MMNPFEKQFLAAPLKEVRHDHLESSIEADLADLTDEAVLLEDLSETFEKHGITLSSQLREMLQEGDKYRWERETGRGNRSGSGFISATRFLADLFKDEPGLRRSRIFDDLEPFYISGEGTALKPEFFEKVKAALGELADPGAKLMGGVVWDLVKPEDNGDDETLTELPFYQGEKKVGTCTTAELYFLEWMNPQRGYDGRMSAIVDEQRQPLLLEKVGLGNNHSCLSLREFTIQGVRVPPGSLVYVDREIIPGEGKVIDLNRCKGFSFLRFTTLALPPEHRQSFGKILQFQIENDFPKAESAKLEDFQIKADNLVRFNDV